jgi:hypothetical protein
MLRSSFCLLNILFSPSLRFVYIGELCRAKTPETVGFFLGSLGDAAQQESTVSANEAKASEAAVAFADVFVTNALPM